MGVATHLESSVVLAACVGLDLTRDEELSGRRCDGLGSCDQFLFLRLSHHHQVGRLTQIAGRRGYQLGLETTDTVSD